MMRQTLVLLTSLLFISCRNDIGANISCRLKWYDQSQFAGIYVAEDLGFFKNNGINCKVYPGGLNNNPLLSVASGSDDFGITGADQVIIARSKGIPIVCIGVILRESPVCFFSLKGSQIKSPYDFIGKKVAMQYGTNVRSEYLAMMSILKINPNEVIEVPSSLNMQSLYNGDVDVWNGYSFNEPIIAESNGFDVNIIKPGQYGVNFYADCVITTETMIKNNPDLVRNFMTALIKGWDYAIQNIDEAARLALKRSSNLSYEHEYQMLTVISELIQANTKEENIGQMDAEIWSQMIETLTEQGIIANSIDLHSLFTNEFLH